MTIYFVRAGWNGPVKIGRSNNVAIRIADIQLLHYEKLNIIRMIKGGKSSENYLHNNFIKQRVRGEWYIYSDDMKTIEIPEHVSKFDNDPINEIEYFDETDMRTSLVSEVAESGIPVRAILSEAGVSAATWDRWKHGRGSPTLRLYIKVQSAVRRLTAELGR